MAYNVLITGANGHLGYNLTEHFLHSGYQVTAMVRSQEGGKIVGQLANEQLKIVFGDILDLESLRKAMAGAQAVIHAAAPNRPDLPSKAIFESIVQGTQNVIQCALAQRVKRMVFTSSCSAAGMRADPYRPITELMWEEDVSSPLLQAKIIAEKNAFRDLADQPMEFISVLLPAVIGPKFHRHTPQTKMYQRLIEGKIVPAPNLGFHILDARDAAHGHRLALERGKPMERYILAGDFFTTRSLGEQLGKLNKNYQALIRIVPDWLIRASIPLDYLKHKLTGTPRELSSSLVRDLLGLNQIVSCKKTKKHLGFNTRPAIETFADTLQWVTNYFCP